MEKESVVNEELNKQGLKLRRALYRHPPMSYFGRHKDEIQAGAKPRHIILLTDNEVSFGPSGLNIGQKKIVEQFGGVYDSSLSCWVILVS